MNDKRAFEAKLDEFWRACAIGKFSERIKARAAVLQAYDAGREGQPGHRCSSCDHVTEVQRVCENCGERCAYTHPAPKADTPHGVMPAKLAQKLRAFAAEREGSANWTMIAWSLHQMLNAKPFTHPAPKSDAAADWVCVPREPTPEMIDAARSQSSFPQGVYRAMLAASPAPKTDAAPENKP